MELGGGSGSAAKRQGISSSNAAAAAAGPDRLSALPDDVLVLVLLKLSTRAAAQTRVLSKRWRRIWALLPALSFPSAPEPHRLRDALDGHAVLLRDLLVGADGATPESLAVWLPAAARRVSGRVALRTCGQVEDAVEDDGGEEEAARRGALELPCFEEATAIYLDLDFLALAMPVAGVFARLTELYLFSVWFHGPGELGDAVSSPRCLRLQKLTIEDACGLQDLAIHSESMLSLELTRRRALFRLTVVAPALKELTMKSCFLESEPVANISAPLLTELDWYDRFDSSSVHLDKMPHLQSVSVQGYRVYGEMFVHNERSKSCLSLLQRIKRIKSLSLPLVYPRDIENYDYLMEGMAVLPNITLLCLMVRANGHAFGASAFHVLRLCTGIRSLKLELDNVVSKLIEWETEELLLNHLEEVEIDQWRGTEHEVAFVKRLFDWGTELKEMTVHFKYFSTSEVKAKELYESFQSFCRPGVCVKFYRDGLLYAPKD